MGAITGAILYGRHFGDYDPKRKNRPKERVFQLPLSRYHYERRTWFQDFFKGFCVCLGHRTVRCRHNHPFQGKTQKWSKQGKLKGGLFVITLPLHRIFVFVLSWLWCVLVYKATVINQRKGDREIGFLKRGIWISRIKINSKMVSFNLGWHRFCPLNSFLIYSII